MSKLNLSPSPVSSPIRLADFPNFHTPWMDMGGSSSTGPTRYGDPSFPGSSTFSGPSDFAGPSNVGGTSNVEATPPYENEHLGGHETSQEDVGGGGFEHTIDAQGNVNPNFQWPSDDEQSREDEDDRLG